MKNLKENQLVRYDLAEVQEAATPWIPVWVLAQADQEEKIPRRKCPIFTP